MKDPLIEYVLHLADNSLILAQRNSEWCGHGPVLEQDIAITNISLDLLGQSRNLYQYAAAIIGGDATEDSLAYLRTEREFRNCQMVELPKGDWAFTILRQFFFSAYQELLFKGMLDSKNVRLAAIAEKSLKEVNYHLRWSSEWVIRLGDGTDESNKRLNHALGLIWPYCGEIFEPADYEKEMSAVNVGIDPFGLKNSWLEMITRIFSEATIKVPAASVYHSGGKSGIHTEHLGYILSDMQYLQRTYPGAEW